MNFEHELIICIVNSGFSTLVMDVARECGAKGGTIINGRGTAKEDIEEKYNITISPEKEVVLIVVKSELKEKLMHALYVNVGLDTPSQGITFSMPVDDVVGIKG